MHHSCCDTDLLLVSPSICQSLLLMHCLFLYVYCFHTKWSGQTAKSADLGGTLNYASELILTENTVVGACLCGIMCLYILYENKTNTEI